MSRQYDHYQEVQNLIAMLRCDKLNKHANALHSAMDDGCTGNEIFMALQWNIEKLISEVSVRTLA